MINILTFIILGSATFTVPIEDTSAGIFALPFPDFGVFFTTIVQAFLIVSALGSFIYLIIGGFQYITSGGDKVGMQSAKDRITYAIMGLAIVAGAGAFSFILGAVTGINIFGKIVWPGP